MASRSNRSRGWIEARSAAVPSMPGPRSSTTGPSRQAFDLQDQRRRTVRIFIAAEREAIERRQVFGIADQRKTGDRRIRDDRRAGVELEPFGDVRRRRHPRIEPDRRIVVEQGQRDRGGATHHRGRRAGCGRDTLNAAGTRHRIHHGPEGRLRRQHLVGKSCGQFGNARHVSPHPAPACRNRPALPPPPRPCGFAFRSSPHATARPPRLRPRQQIRPTAPWHRTARSASPSRRSRPSV